MALFRFLRGRHALAAAVVRVWRADDEALRLQPGEQTGHRRVRQVEPLLDVLRVDDLARAVVQVAQDVGLRRRQLHLLKLLVDALFARLIEQPKPPEQK